MNTVTLSPPPRPPRNGRVVGGLGDPDKKGSSGHFWWRRCLKLVVAMLLVIAVTQLAVILFQTVRLWFSF